MKRATQSFQHPSKSHQASLPLNIPEPIKGTFVASETRRRLKRLLQQDLSFETPTIPRMLHNTHAFAAKFPPELPRLFIDKLTKPGELVIDPMVGSGTAVVEAALAGRIGIGFDIDPLAVRLTQVKVTPQDVKRLATIVEKVLQRVTEADAAGVDNPWSLLAARYEPRIVDFFRYWFLPETAGQLGLLIQAIEKVRDPLPRYLFEIAFSSIIVTKSGGVSLARDLAHSRPHKVKDKKVRSVIAAFRERVNRMLLGLETISDAPGKATALLGDARRLPLKDDAVSLVVTSPPYANAIDYLRAHKFSLFWLGHGYDDLVNLRRKYIGAEVRETPQGLPSSTANKAISAVGRSDKLKAGILFRYFRDMYTALREMHRVLKHGHAAIIVVGPSQVRGVDVKTHIAIAELGVAAGFELAGTAVRPISRNRRLMPVAHDSPRQGIEARIHEEHVLALLKVR